MPAERSDELVLDGKRRDDDLAKISACVDLLRRKAGVDTRVRVVTRNNFPTGAGLASSASGFAALVRAAEGALGLTLSPRERSIVARQGSGSAARSIFGGFVEMHAGTAADGNDSFAEPLLESSEWPLEVVIAVTAKGEKEIGSRSGMTRSATSSPYYAAWVAGQPPDLAAARAAIRARDFAALAEVAEHNCLKMHAAALAAQPPLVYWNGATVECLHAVRRLRAGGVPVFFTIDAGPQLKAVCLPGALAIVERTLRGVPGVLELLTSALGPGAELR
jgi:diphosphomevalonate decarboxylase